MLSPLSLRDPQSYAEVWTIPNHRKPVTFVSFSNSGELLATGDDDGYVHIWSISSKQLFQSLAKCSAEALSCCWSDDKEIFVGTGHGELHFFGHVPAQNRFERNTKVFVDGNKAHIASVAIHTNRLACCAGNTVHCYRIEGSNLQKMFSCTVTGVREMRTVHFLDRQTILAAALREGECILLDVLEPMHPLWRRKLRHRIGESALSPDGRYFAATTLAASVRIYEVTSTGLNLLHDLQAPNRLSSNFPLQVCFAESQSLVVSGSDCGEVRSWDLATGRTVVLRHSKGSANANDLQLVQSVAARSTTTQHLIASACSESSATTVKVWGRPRQNEIGMEVALGVAAVALIVSTLAVRNDWFPPYSRMLYANVVRVAARLLQLLDRGSSDGFSDS